MASAYRTPGHDNGQAADTMRIMLLPFYPSPLKTSRRLFEQTRLPLTTTFRAGGYLGTPKVLQALQGEFAAYWGVDAADKSVCLVVDFDVFTQVSVRWSTGVDPRFATGLAEHLQRRLSNAEVSA